MVTLDDLKKQDYELIIVHAGNSFLGMASMVNEKGVLVPVPRGDEKGKSLNNQDMEEGGAILLLNAFPTATAPSPNGPVPALGSLHWLVLEGVTELRIRPLWHYWVSNQSEASQKEFYNAYIRHHEGIEEMRFFKNIADSGLIMASPGDIARAEATARKMGFPNLQEALSAVKGPTPQP